MYYLVNDTVIIRWECKVQGKKIGFGQLYQFYVIILICSRESERESII